MLSAPMKIWTPFRVLGALQQADEVVPLVQGVEQLADALEVGERGDILDEVGPPRTMRLP